jgi:hypothetical protein
MFLPIELSAEDRIPLNSSIPVAAEAMTKKLRGIGVSAFSPQLQNFGIARAKCTMFNKHSSFKFCSTGQRDFSRLSLVPLAAQTPKSRQTQTGDDQH